MTVHFTAIIKEGKIPLYFSGVERNDMYIDPNTGGVLFQALAAALAVASGALLIFSGKIRALIARLRRRLRNKDEEAQ
jgi:hypothetical protein